MDREQEESEYWRDEEIGDHDTANRLWGGDWRMPSSEEFQALISNCYMSWTDDYKNDDTGIKGMIFTGKDGAYQYNSVFFPSGGFYHNRSLSEENFGFYWSTTNSSEFEGAYYLHLVDNAAYLDNSLPYPGECAIAVRPVLYE